MGASSYTPLVNLPQFSDTDRPTFRGDITGAFNDIDSKFGDVDTNVNGKVSKGELIINAADYGAVADWTAPGTGTDQTAHIQAALDATPYGGTCYLPPVNGKRYMVAGTLNVISGRTLRGGGYSWARSSLLGFGDASHNSLTNIRGSVIQSTATTAIPAVQMNAGAGAEPSWVRDLAIVGPGSGLSIGLAAGIAAATLIEGGVSNVAITNFNVGMSAIHCNECVFQSVSIYGCTDGAQLNTDINNNLFLMLDVQRCAVGLNITDPATYANTFITYLSQNNDIGAKLRGEHHVMLNPYFEQSTTRDLEIYGLYCMVVAPDSQGNSAGVRKILVDAAGAQNAITGLKYTTTVTNNAFGTYLQGSVTQDAASSALASAIVVDTNTSTVSTRFLKMGGKLSAAASSGGGASINIPPGSVPAAPNDGDIWVTAAGMFIRIAGVTKTVTLT